MAFQSRVRGSVPRAVASAWRPPGARPFATGIFGTVSLIGIVSQQLSSSARKHPPGALIYACTRKARRAAKNTILLHAACVVTLKGLLATRASRAVLGPRLDAEQRGRGRPGSLTLRRDDSPHQPIFHRPRELSRFEPRTGASRTQSAHSFRYIRPAPHD